MSALASDLRRQLENVIIEARDVAEAAARSALQKRAVDVGEPFSHFGIKEKGLRNRLRARGRQLGDVRNADKTQSIDQLTQELAYEFWHRMLFARFLAENHLLMHPDGVAVSLEECEELASEVAPPAPNGFVLAARYASTMLPQIFRTDDVLLEIDFAPEQRLALEKLLGSLPRQTFLADDSLGWVYQFWQSKRKDEVNKSGNKIDSRTISSVTQLFTEDYMVQFLLHNTLGAWWCAKSGISGQGAGVKAGDCPVALEYLRWREDGTPAAGKFERWPKTLKKFTLLDPCCGSGHFLVAAFNLLVPLRMHDEGLSAREACDVVLRDNLFGLELDPRCTQIAAFALAVAAWKYSGRDGQPLGYRELPPLNIACTGIGPQASEEEWLKLAERAAAKGGLPVKRDLFGAEPNLLSSRVAGGLTQLYQLFQQAPELGSLINPRSVSGDLLAANFRQLQPLLAAAMVAEQSDDDDADERAVAAAGMVKAAELLAGEYTLVITNVPYLGRGKQDDTLKQHLEHHYPNSKADLATAFVERCLEFCAKDGTSALVTPQNWQFLGSYTKMRESLLKQRTWSAVVKLGEEAWWSFGIRGPRTVLFILSQSAPSASNRFLGIDVSTNRGEQIILLDEKASLLRGDTSVKVAAVTQADQLLNPEWRITFDIQSEISLLQERAVSSQGIPTSDGPLFIRAFWELNGITPSWEFHLGSAVEHIPYSGREHVILFEQGKGRLRQMSLEQSRDRRRDFQGANAWGKMGVAVGVMSELLCTLYSGEKFHNNVAAVVPEDQADVLPLWTYCTSPEFAQEVRRVDQKVNVTNATLVKVPFDLAYWQQVAAEKYPNGLPEPESDDPTQWLFHGRPESSNTPLQVAVARLLGYRWPAELDQKMRLSKRARELVQRSEELLPLADRDGLVPISSVRGEPPAAERMLEVFHAAYGKSWSDSVLHRLLSEAGCPPGTTLDDWLRNSFFEQHCKRFQNRPFIWHIWDGRKDGFSVLVNYHKLNHKTLENLTYAYIGDWITAQSKSDKVGADLRLAAAQQLQEKLKLILAGEPPYDIFVRWKPLSEQPIGWNPDLNDGVRMNIRPFIEAGILRKNPNIQWTKDRGKEPQRDKAEFPWFWTSNDFTGDRVNDVHLTNKMKTDARK